jgi:hypothetical protein
MRVTEAGIELDAEFEVEEIDGLPTFTMHSHSGASGGRPRRNPQYGDALRVILERLADIGAVITDALVASSDALRNYPEPDDRRLERGVTFPIQVKLHDPNQLRTSLTEAMRATARDPSLGPGGNNRRRVTFYLNVPGKPPMRELAAYLASGAVADGSSPAGGAGSNAAGRMAPLTTGPAGRARSRAQGYVADAAYRRAVELHAMQQAVEHYEDGWDVEDSSAGNPYDLVLTGRGETRYVEVKGTAGQGEQINLTANEVDHARRHSGLVALFILHGIDVDRSNPAEPRASGGTVRIIDPLNLAEGDLRATDYIWVVPRR